MNNKFNKIASKTDLTESGMIISTLIENPPSDAPSESAPIFNIKQMIDARVNFNVIYNLLKNKKTLNTCLLHTSNSNSNGYPLFTYNGAVKGVMIKTTSSGINAQPTYDCINGTTNILSNATSSSSSGLPIITTQCGSTAVPTNEFGHSEEDEPLYYFIPASTTSSSTGYIGLGVLSNCWTNISTGIKKWIVGRRLSINKSYNYIIEVTPNQELDYNYTYKIYSYSNAGAFNGVGGQPTSVTMNSLREDYTKIDGGDSIAINRVNSYSVNNRLSGNFFDIINGFKCYNGVNNACNVESRACVGFYCQQRSGNGTGPISYYHNFHIAPLKNSSASGTNSTLDAYSGTNRPFGLYRNITFVDLTRFSMLGATLQNSSLIVYPGEVTLNSYVNGYSNVKLNNTNIYRLDDKITNINTLNSFNNLIDVTVSPLNSIGGRNLYIILSPQESNIKVYCNCMTNYSNNIWNMGASSLPANHSLRQIGTLSSSNYYIIETWWDAGNSYVKMYTYNGTTGNCTAVSATMKALIS
jgi:hypothetical protein